LFVFGVYQASYATFLDYAVLHMEAMTPEQIMLSIMDEDFLEIADLV
jgi:hypothetical protein